MYLVYLSLGKLSSFPFYFFLLFFYFFLIISTINIIFEFVSAIHNCNIGKPKYYIIYEILKFVILISLLYSTYYWIIEDYDKSNFLNVKNGNGFQVYLDFYFYTVTSFLMNNSSDIKPNSFLSKGLVLTQVIFSFVTIVVFLSQYKEFGDISKEIEDRINKK